MDFIIKNKVFIIASVVLVIIVAFVLAFVFGGGEAEPNRIEISTTEDVDFDNGAAHTADAGIAVIGSKPGQNPADNPVVPDVVRMSTTQVQGTADSPDAVWADADSLTHGGFTIAVPTMDGESIGLLTVPDIGLSVRVYEGENDMAMMEKGVARFRHTSAWEGHIGLSAHNINLNGTPGHFLNIHTLQNGAVIRYETALGVREYAVDNVFEVDEYDWSALARTQENRISLVTCITGKSTHRLVVTGAEIS